MKWPYSLGLQPWHTYVQCINSFSFIQYYKCIASSSEMRATTDMLPLERSRDYWLFGWEGKQLHFKQLCFVSKGKRQYVFHCQGPLFQDSIPSYSFCTGYQRPLEAQAQYMDSTVRQDWVQVPALLCLLAGTLMNLTMIHFTKRKTVIILTP